MEIIEKPGRLTLPKKARFTPKQVFKITYLSKNYTVNKK